MCNIHLKVLKTIYWIFIILKKGNKICLNLFTLDPPMKSVSFQISKSPSLDLPKNFFKKNRERLLKKLEGITGGFSEGSLAFFQSTKTIPVDDQDVEYSPQQECNFFYLFGIVELDSYAMIDLASGRSYVFIPKLDESLKIWMKIYPLEHYRSLI